MSSLAPAAQGSDQGRAPSSLLRAHTTRRAAPKARAVFISRGILEVLILNLCCLGNVYTEFEFCSL